MDKRANFCACECKKERNKEKIGREKNTSCIKCNTYLTEIE